MRLPRPIPAFKDNYIWMFCDPVTHTALVVDPGEADPVLKILSKEGLKLTTIIVTHHHFDHSGGALELMEKTEAKVFGPNSTLFPGALRLQEGENVHFPEMDLIFTVLEIPGHTLDHIALVSNSSKGERKLLFCGDTLFTAGCGRVFEGTFEQMMYSLQRLKQLEPSTLVYCGHEYTEANLKFAKMVEPENEKILNRIEAVALKRKAMQPTVPSTLAEELDTNPFLRTDKITVRQSAERYAGKNLDSEVEVFATIRKWKNDFS